MVSVRRAIHNSQSDTSNFSDRNRQSSLITVPSSGIQTFLEEADSDVLLLYDCCHSAAITTTGDFQGNKGVKEVISACGYETIAPEVDEHSFTNALIETLAMLSKGTPFSVGELHSRVLSCLKCWTASLLYDDDGKVLKTPEGNLVSERQPRRTPIYSILRESTPRRSIVFAPLTLAQPAPEGNTQANPSITPSNATPGLDIDGKAISSKKSKKRKRAHPKEPSWPQIVLSVRLDEAELEISTWREWIRSLPAEAKDIKIEGMYKSFSTLLLIRMPVSIWNLLPDNGAYSFVGYVTSENLSFQDLETQAWSEGILDKPQATKNANEHPKGISSIQEPLKDTLQKSSISRDTTPFESEDEGLNSKSTSSLSPSFSSSSTWHKVFPPPSSTTLILKDLANTPVSTKPKRRETGTLALACVPCKRAHLRCDGQRPCSRCLANGKEDACVEVQSKKRSRPRLRDESESRYEGVGTGYPALPEASMRRPLSLYSTGEAFMASGSGDTLHRSGQYRVLKSQIGSMPGLIAPRYIDYASAGDTNIYGGSMPLTPRILPPQEPICAYLTMEMQIAKTTQNFGDTIALQPIVGKKLQDILSPNDQEKVLRLQRTFEEERREREPNYVSPIFLNNFEDKSYPVRRIWPGSDRATAN